MTHDELLARVSHPLAESYNGYFLALTAVLELHNPITETFKDDFGQDETMTWCAECPDDDFPCRTLQAMQKHIFNG